MVNSCIESVVVSGARGFTPPQAPAWFNAPVRGAGFTT
jgi:hypothetical protein